MREFYTNLDASIKDSNSEHYEVVYARGMVVAFPPSTIAHFLSCPYHTDIPRTGLEREADWNNVAYVLTGGVLTA